MSWHCCYSANFEKLKVTQTICPYRANYHTLQITETEGFFGNVDSRDDGLDRERVVSCRNVLIYTRNLPYLGN